VEEGVEVPVAVPVKEADEVQVPDPELERVHVPVEVKVPVEVNVPVEVHVPVLVQVPVEVQVPVAVQVPVLVQVPVVVSERVAVLVDEMVWASASKEKRDKTIRITRNLIVKNM